MIQAGGLTWIIDTNGRPAIIAGYATTDAEKMSSPDQIIKFHFRERPTFNVVSTMVDYAVKHTRVGMPQVKIFDDEIPTKFRTDNKTTQDYLMHIYRQFVVKVANAFRELKVVVPPVEPFEESSLPQKSATKLKSRANVTQGGKISKRSKVSKKAKAPGLSDRYRSILEEDEDDGPMRCLTPIRKTAAATLADAVKKEHPDSAANYTLEETEDGVTIVLDQDTPMPSTEDWPGLFVPDDAVEGAELDTEELDEDFE
jgi:hypothetical protein